MMETVDGIKWFFKSKEEPCELCGKTYDKDGVMACVTCTFEYDYLKKHGAYETSYDQDREDALMGEGIIAEKLYCDELEFQHRFDQKARDIWQA